MDRNYKKLKKQLDRENKRVLAKIELYLSNNNVREKIYKNKLNEILLKTIEAQKEEQCIEDIVGYDYENFCEKFIKGSPKNNFLEIIIDFIYNIINYVGIIVFTSILISLLGSHSFVFITGYTVEIDIPYFIYLSILLIGMNIITNLKYKVFFMKRKNKGMLEFFLIMIHAAFVIYLRSSILPEEYFMKINVLIILLIWGINFALHKLIQNIINNK